MLVLQPVGFSHQRHEALLVQNTPYQYIGLKPNDLFKIDDVNALGFVVSNSRVGSQPHAPNRVFGELEGPIWDVHPFKNWDEPIFELWIRSPPPPQSDDRANQGVRDEHSDREHDPESEHVESD